MLEKRIVPIHSIIKPLIENRMKEAAALQSKYLFNDENGQQGTYQRPAAWTNIF